MIYIYETSRSRVHTGDEGQKVEVGIEYWLTLIEWMGAARRMYSPVDSTFL